MNIEKLLAEVESLSTSELKKISAKIFEILNGTDNVCLNCNDNHTVSCCKKCGCTDILKYGKDKNGKQRYKCNGCGCTFVYNSCSVISNSNKRTSVWMKYIDCLLGGYSLAKCAFVCDISVQTVFLWRHKILSALAKDQCGRRLSGIIEADETYFAVSYKGNHTRNSNFVLPRKAHRRGNDCKDMTGSRACVMYALERNGQTYGECLGKGQPTVNVISYAFGDRLERESIFISDKASGTCLYFAQRDDIEFVSVAAHVNPKLHRSPPEIRGVYHIQNINNMHARFRRFLRPYNGVATKYLNNYVNLFVWLENHKKKGSADLKNDVIFALGEHNTFTSRFDISSWPAVPSVA